MQGSLLALLHKYISILCVEQQDRNQGVLRSLRTEESAVREKNFCSWEMGVTWRQLAGEWLIMTDQMRSWSNNPPRELHTSYPLCRMEILQRHDFILKIMPIADRQWEYVREDRWQLLNAISLSLEFEGSVQNYVACYSFWGTWELISRKSDMFCLRYGNQVSTLSMEILSWPLRDICS